jgi:hypothetical protein
LRRSGWGRSEPHRASDAGRNGAEAGAETANSGRRGGGLELAEPVRRHDAASTRRLPISCDFDLRVFCNRASLKIAVAEAVELQRHRFRFMLVSNGRQRLAC